jgi:hypothetical protein
MTFMPDLETQFALLKEAIGRTAGSQGAEPGAMR